MSYPDVLTREAAFVDDCIKLQLTMLIRLTPIEARC
jgi:hypothetical protein